MSLYIPSKEGSSASASDRAVCCAKMRGPIQIDSSKINNERIFIPDLYPQISQNAFFCHVQRRRLPSRSFTPRSGDISGRVLRDSSTSLGMTESLFNNGI